MSIEPEILSHIKRKTRLVQQGGIIFSFFFCFMTSLSSIFARDQNLVTQYRVKRKIQSRTLSDVVCIFKNCVARQTLYLDYFCLYDRVIIILSLSSIPSLCLCTIPKNLGMGQIPPPRPAFLATSGFRKRLP